MTRCFKTSASGIISPAEIVQFELRNLREEVRGRVQEPTIRVTVVKIPVQVVCSCLPPSSSLAGSRRSSNSPALATHSLPMMFFDVFPNLLQNARYASNEYNLTQFVPKTEN